MISMALTHVRRMGGMETLGAACGVADPRVEKIGERHPHPFAQSFQSPPNLLSNISKTYVQVRVNIPNVSSAVRVERLR